MPKTKLDVIGKKQTKVEQREGSERPEKAEEKSDKPTKSKKLKEPKEITAIIKKPKLEKKKKKKNKKSKSRARKLHRMIKLEQSSKVTAIKKASFARQVKLALSVHQKGDLPMRITPKAISALQEAAEQHMVQRFSDALAIASRHDKLTPTDVDLRLVCSLKPVAGAATGSC